MADFPIDFAYLVASWCEAVLWGVYGVLFVLCLWLIFNSGKLHLVQLTGLIALYILGTCHISLDFARLIQGFIYTDSGLDRIEFFSNVALRINVAKDFLYITSLIIGDSVIVWRCWIVWAKTWAVVALPILMVLGEAVSGYTAIGKYLSPDLATDASVKPWGTAMFSLSLATNIIVTSLTAGRIWWISRAASKLRTGRSASSAAIILIIESGLAITIAKIIEFTTYQIAFAGTVNMQAIYIMFEVMPQLFGIIPTLILLSIQIGVTSSKAYTTATISQPFSRSTRTIGGSGGTPGARTIWGRRTRSTFPAVSIEMNQYREEEQSDGEHGKKSFAPSQTLGSKTSTFSLSA